MFDFEFAVDDTALKARLDAIARDVSGSHRPALERIADVLAKSISLQFGEDLKPLKESTVRSRRRRVERGEKLVAGLETPLRAFNDRIYKAATATEPGTTGSAFLLEDDAVTVGINKRGLKFAPYAVGLKGSNPLRLPTTLTDEARSEAIGIVGEDLDRRIVRWNNL